MYPLWIDLCHNETDIDQVMVIAATGAVAIGGQNGAAQMIAM